VAGLLDAFNREYDTPTPGTAVLTTWLERLLAGENVIALLSGDPAGAVSVADPAPERLVGRSGCPARRARRRARAAWTRTRLRTAHDRRGHDPTARQGRARDQRRWRRHRRPPVLRATRLREQRTGPGPTPPVLLPRAGRRLIAGETADRRRPQWTVPDNPRAQNRDPWPRRGHRPGGSLRLRVVYSPF